MDVRESTDRITLHANNLTIYNESIKVERLTFNPKKEEPSSPSKQDESDDGSSSFFLPKSRSIRAIGDSKGTTINPKLVSTAIEKDNDFFIIYLNNQLVAGNSYSLSIKFLGNLNKDLAGFYRSSYNDTNTNQKR